jgi:hypothetical protein
VHNNLPFRLNWPLGVCCAVQKHASSCACARGVGGMAKDSGVPPLPRRVPGAANSPRPPARVESPVLPESVRQRLLKAHRSAQSTAPADAAPPEKSRPEKAAAAERGAPPEKREQPEKAAPAKKAEGKQPAPPKQAPAPEPETSTEGSAPREHAAPQERTAPREQAASLTRAAPPQRAVPAPRKPPETGDEQSSPTGVKHRAQAPSSPQFARLTDVPTEPFPRVGEPTDGDAVTPVAAEPGTGQAKPRSAVGPPLRGSGTADRRDRKRPPSGRPYRLAGLLIAVMALITAASLALTLSGHTRAAAHGRTASQNPRAEAQTRSLAAAWVASQVSRTAPVACDPVMCRTLESHGFPASDLSQLGPDTTSPLREAVIVATPAVRAQFGNLLGAVYAPTVIASFGSGQLRIDIRQIAPHGAAAYRAQLNADLLARKTSGAALLRFGQITFSAAARRQLLAGQVDSRLLIAITSMAVVRPVYLVGFSTSAPHGDPVMPLRFADVIQAGHGSDAASRSVTRGFVRSMMKVLRSQQAPYVPAHAGSVRTATGQLVLRIEFSAPSPLDLLGPQQPN